MEIGIWSAYADLCRADDEVKTAIKIGDINTIKEAKRKKETAADRYGDEVWLQERSLWIETGE